MTFEAKDKEFWHWWQTKNVRRTGKYAARDAWDYQQEQIAQLQARLESEEAHYARLVEQGRESNGAS